MIDFFALHAALNSTVVLRQRGFIFANNLQRKLSTESNIFNSVKRVSIKQGQQYLRDSIKLQASIMLRDKGRDKIIIDPNSSPITFRIFSDEYGLSSFLEGDEDVH